MNTNVFSLIGITVCSFCLAAENLPDPNDWFIQTLARGGDYAYELQMSDTYVIWEGNYGAGTQTYFYDGTGIYPLGCMNASVSGNSIVGRAGAGILFFRGNVNKVITSGQSDEMDPDVYENQVVWQGGPDYEKGYIYYYNDDDPFQSVYPIAADAKTPKISENAIAWLGYDGNDFEVFIAKDQVVHQLTNNTVNEDHLQMSDDGQLAWMSWDPMYERVFGYVHYYDGQRVRQMTVGNTHSWLCGISEKGVLYTADYHPDYPLFDTVLLHHNGTEERLIAGSESIGIYGASIGGNSIAWIQYDNVSQKYHMNYLKGQELIQWPLVSTSIHEIALTGVWGNRVVWPSFYSDLYFGEYLHRDCISPPRMDTNDDCQVTMADFVVFASEWMMCGYKNQNDCY